MRRCRLVMERCQMDLLQRLRMRGSMEAEFGRFERGGGEEVELSLGLSLGGIFGVEKVGGGKLVRSPSVAGTMAVSMEEEEDEEEEEEGEEEVTGMMSAALLRTASLPAEAGEEWRKRKELQTLRRLEAKRRRSEKQRIVRGEKEAEEIRDPPHAAATAAAVGGGLLLLRGKKGRGGGVHGFGKSSSSPGESQGGSSSGMSESESKSAPGRWEGEWRRGGKEAGRRGRKRSVGIEEMPCVFTKGDGPEGRRVEGILYKYGRREEVRIMCVCHGTFLSPSDFIRHAGGSHVSNPLRHIVVVTPSSFF